MNFLICGQTVIYDGSAANTKMMALPKILVCGINILISNNLLKTKLFLCR